MRAPLTIDDRHALQRALKDVRAAITALAAGAELWAAQGSKDGTATIELLQRGLALRRALARLNRHLVLRCGGRLTEESVRRDPGALRSLVQLLPLMHRLSCLRCRVATSTDAERGEADRPQPPHARRTVKAP